MREIKFRAWTGDDMVDVSAIIFDEGTKVSPYEPHILDSHNDVHLLKDIELMQYTGLRDKNGTEIYEGDVVMVRSQYETDEPIECQSKVFSADGSFRCDFHDMVLNKNLCAGIGNWSIEVIGNIHETGIDNNSGF